MMSNSRSNQTQQENQLWVSWHDTQMMNMLNTQTAMDYFCRKSNPFYDSSCNNETIRMQRMTMEHLNNMTGVEYILLHVFEPILYVIRKQHRHSPKEETPLADYYIIGGVVYKAPDLASVINSRILSTVTNLQAAFEDASSYSRYHPNKGYYWDFSTNKSYAEKSKHDSKKDNKDKEDGGTVFQVQRVDMLLGELLRKFPPPMPNIVQDPQMMQLPQTGIAEKKEVDTESVSGSSSIVNRMNQVASPAPSQGLLEVKVEDIDMKPPPEKRRKDN